MHAAVGFAHGSTGMTRTQHFGIHNIFYSYLGLNGWRDAEVVFHCGIYDVTLTGGETEM